MNGSAWSRTGFMGHMEIKPSWKAFHALFEFVT